MYRSIGELTRSDSGNKQSDAAFLKALELERKLVGRFPENTEYLADLVKTSAGRCSALVFEAFEGSRRRL